LIKKYFIILIILFITFSCFNKIEKLTYYEFKDSITQELLDGNSIQFKIVLGYKCEDIELRQQIYEEFDDKKNDIIIISKNYLSTKNTKFIRAETGSSLDKIEKNLIKLINPILQKGKIKRILFQQYNLLKK
jgi:hypothetical protein